MDSCAADVWSLGLMLYLLLTDRFPYVQPGKEDLPATACRQSSLVPPSQFNEKVNPRLDAIVRRRPPEASERYADATRMLADLEKSDASPPGGDQGAERPIISAGKENRSSQYAGHDATECRCPVAGGTAPPHSSPRRAN